MSLTSAQLTTLKNDIAADGALNAQPNTADGAVAIAAAYNALAAAPNFFVWATSVPVSDVLDAIVWANLTPADAADTTLQYQNRAVICQGKQLSLQIMLQGRTTLNGAKVNVRAGLQDALQAIPSGVGGANQTAGFAAVQNALSRRATRGEKLYADTSLGNGSTRPLSATLVVEGLIDFQDVLLARAS